MQLSINYNNRQKTDILIFLMLINKKNNISHLINALVLFKKTNSNL